MRKKLNKSDIKVVHSYSFKEMKKLVKKMPYPFDERLICLLKDENKLEQEYYYIENWKDYAFFILYKNKMNIFTFGKLKCFFNIKVIGYPCSLSNCGYVTNNEKFMFDYIRTISGAKLVLNVSNNILVDDMTIGETLPTCILKIKYSSLDEYLLSLRSGYRRRINIAISNCKDIEIKEIVDDSIDIYDLYINTYNKSNYKLEKLEKGFFEKVDAKKLVFLRDNKPIGFVLIKQDNKKLIFMLCGMDYHYDTVDLYYYMLLNIIKYAIDNKCETIDFGQTSEETKMKFGALLEKKYFYAHHTNPVLNYAVKLCKNVLEYKYDFPKYRVFRRNFNESITN